MVCVVVIWKFVSMSHHPRYQKCDLDDDSDDDKDKDDFDPLPSFEASTQIKTAVRPKKQILQN